MQMPRKEEVTDQRADPFEVELGRQWAFVMAQCDQDLPLKTHVNGLAAHIVDHETGQVRCVMATDFKDGAPDRQWAKAAMMQLSLNEQQKRRITIAERDELLRLRAVLGIRPGENQG